MLALRKIPEKTKHAVRDLLGFLTDFETLAADVFEEDTSNIKHSHFSDLRDLMLQDCRGSLLCSKYELYLGLMH